MQTKVCTKCGEEKELTGFHKNKCGKFGVDSVCKLCKAEYARGYYRKNRDYYKQYYKENREHLKQYARHYYKENREYYKQWREENRGAILEYRKQYYHSNPQRKISDLIGSRTRRLVLQGKAKKFCGYNDYIGCTPEELVAHLESQFYQCPSTGREMTWDNHGDWHIDHIRPLASFDLLDEDEFMQAHHYTNLQPLWAEGNLSKGATWDEQTS